MTPVAEDYINWLKDKDSIKSFDCMNNNYYYNNNTLFKKKCFKWLNQEEECILLKEKEVL